MALWVVVLILQVYCELKKVNWLGNSIDTSAVCDIDSLAFTQKLKSLLSYKLVLDEVSLWNSNYYGLSLGVYEKALFT